MANYDLMIAYIKSTDKDIKLLQEHPSSKAFVKKLIKLQEYTRDAWAKIHSLVKSLSKTTPEENFRKTQAITESVLVMNLDINDFYDKLTQMGINRKVRGNEFFLNYVLEEMFYNYTLLLDSIHYMGLIYVVAQSFPFMLSNSFAERKMREYGIVGYEDDKEDGP
jgi:hypothetical protein